MFSTRYLKRWCAPLQGCCPRVHRKFFFQHKTAGSGQHVALSIKRMPALLLAGCQRRLPSIFQKPWPPATTTFRSSRRRSPSGWLRDRTSSSSTARSAVADTARFFSKPAPACSALIAIPRRWPTPAPGSPHSANAFPRGKETSHDSRKSPRSKWGNGQIAC